MVSSIPENLAVVLKRIRACERQFDRAKDSVTLIAVSKTHSVDDIIEAAAMDQRDFGENYVQEALDKMVQLADHHLTWHFIGPIQSNKTREIATHFDWVHTVDREKIAQRLSEQRPEERGPMNVLIQVNISGEASKSGVLPTELSALAATVKSLPNLTLRGLMAIPAPETDIEKQRDSFARLAALCFAIRFEGHRDCTELSMGMSQDYLAAIAEGATMVRIGTDIFGQRSA